MQSAICCCKIFKKKKRVKKVITKNKTKKHEAEESDCQVRLLEIIRSALHTFWAQGFVNFGI